MRTYILDVRPWRDLEVLRTIELTEDQTLHDLHLAIQEAFDLDNDHLYSFFLNNRAFDKFFDYGGPMVTSPNSAPDATLASLSLRQNKRFLYIFDFGDELRHEVKVVGEGTEEEEVYYPRIVGAVGDPPPQYMWQEEDEYEEEVEDEEVEDEEVEDEEVVVNEALAELVPLLSTALEAYDQRRFAAEDSGNRGRESPDDAARERDLAFNLLDKSDQDLDAIHVSVEHALERSVLGWLCDLPRHLSQTGLPEDGVSLIMRLLDMLPAQYLVNDLPLILARAGREEEARSRLEENLAEYPDDPAMLGPAAETLELLGDLQRAETCCREALSWAGSQLNERRDITAILKRILTSKGNAAAIEELQQEESRLEDRLRRDRLEAMGLVGNPTYRRSQPKVGRNAPCPCGSGKKYKKCCGKST